jgi:hypothetical protein
MLNASDLKIGEVYYLVVFYDRNLRVPLIHTYLYEKKEFNVNNNKNEYWFRKPEPQSEYTDIVEEMEYYMVDEAGLFIIYDLRGLIGRLELLFGAS